MTSSVAGWLDVADADIEAVRRMLAPDPEPHLAVAAYHCQQAAEKLVKALLLHAGISFPRGALGHDIGRLAELLPDAHPLRDAASAFTRLTPWVSVFRYPSDDPLAQPPLPDAAFVAAYLERLRVFRAEVAAMVLPRP